MSPIRFSLAMGVLAICSGCWGAFPIFGKNQELALQKRAETKNESRDLTINFPPAEIHPDMIDREDVAKHAIAKWVEAERDVQSTKAQQAKADLADSETSRLRMYLIIATGACLIFAPLILYLWRWGWRLAAESNRRSGLLQQARGLMTPEQVEDLDRRAGGPPKK